MKFTSSFQENSNLAAEVVEVMKKALDHFKLLVQAALTNNDFETPPNHEESPANTVEVVDETATTPLPLHKQEVFIWGIPILGDEKSDTVLLKFLRAKNFKPMEALAMLKKTLLWRKQIGIESLLARDFDVPELEKAVFYHGQDKDDRPVCYNVLRKLQDGEVYDKVFGDEVRDKFLMWRVLLMEKGIRQLLDLNPGEVCSFIHVTDFKNAFWIQNSVLSKRMKKVMLLLQDNYPEFVAKDVFVNVPWWYHAYHRVTSTFVSPRIKSQFVLASRSKTAETLFKYISPENVPVQYGGLSKTDDPDFTTDDIVTENTMPPSSKYTIHLPAYEAGTSVVWELRVLAWDVSYSAEFIPNAADGYCVILQNVRKMIPTDEPILKNCFKQEEPGNIRLFVDNSSSKKKKLLFRYKTMK